LDVGVTLLQWYKLCIFALLFTTLLGCGRYNYYPRGMHQSEQKVVRERMPAYVVRKGDTLYSIGKRHHIDYHQLAKRNGIRKPYTILVGQRLYLGGTKSVAKTSVKVAPKQQRMKQKKKPKSVVYPTAKHSKVKLIWPTQGKLSSKFGPRNNRMHDGLDISAKEGTKILAAAAGKVVYSDSKLSGYGNLIIIRHNSDMFTAYAHNQKNLVSHGDVVKAGQVIAYVGSTGRSSGAHLHFEVRRGETAVDPLAYLPKR